jgi:hypothetical protein
MSRPADLPPEYADKLSAVDRQAAALQKQMAALAAEAAVDGLQPMVTMLERKAGVVRHLREDLATIPERLRESRRGPQDG